MKDNKKAKRLSKEGIKKKLLDSMTIGEIVKFDDLNKEAEEVQHPEKAVIIIERYENIIKTNRKGIINVTYHRGQIFKRFTEKQKFAKLVSELRITKILSFVKIMCLNCAKNTLNY